MHPKASNLYKILLLTVIICCHFDIVIQTKAKKNTANKFISHWVLNQDFARIDFQDLEFHKLSFKNRSLSSLVGIKKAKWLVVSSSIPSAAYAYYYSMDLASTLPWKNCEKYEKCFFRNFQFHRRDPILRAEIENYFFVLFWK